VQLQRSMDVVECSAGAEPSYKVSEGASYQENIRFVALVIADLEVRFKVLIMSQLLTPSTKSSSTLVLPFC
jgi:hypothetical protein